MNINDIKIAYFNNTQFLDLLDHLKVNGVKVNHVENDLAFMCYVPPTIVLKEEVRNLSESEQRIIIAHELAHFHGIIDEEKADIWALDALTTDEEKNILIEQWQHRHGHEYIEGN
jgi:hypothetical protein